MINITTSLGITVEVLKALAPFAWPLLSGLVVFGFRKEFRQLLASLPATLSRVKSAEGPGFKLDMNTQEQITAAAELEAHSMPEPTPLPPPAPASAVDQIRDLGLHSPKAALSLCEEAIELEIRKIMATMGLLSGYLVPSKATLTLEQRGILTTRIRQAVNGFLSLTHDTSLENLSDDAAGDLLSNGLHILELLNAVPRSKHRVCYSDVPIYSDSNATVRIEGASGVILQAVDQHDRPSASTQIFPTTKQMTPGTDVSWEWNLNRTFDETWFRHPKTNEITHAWTSSAEFIGRDLDYV